MFVFAYFEFRSLLVGAREDTVRLMDVTLLLTFKEVGGVVSFTKASAGSECTLFLRLRRAVLVDRPAAYRPFLPGLFAFSAIHW